MILLQYTILIIGVIFVLLCSSHLIKAEGSNISEAEYFTTSNYVNNQSNADALLDSNDNEQYKLKNFMKGEIIGLNKITAKSETMVLKVGESKYFGNIKIKLHKCIKNPDPYNEDNYILLTIIEHFADEDPRLIFQGWMFSSSISLSTFEHPIYEIFARDCL